MQGISVGEFDLTNWKWILLFLGEGKRGDQVERQHTGGHSIHSQDRHRTGVSGQALEVVERHTEIMRQGQFDGVGVEENRDHFVFGMVGGYGFQRGHDARLRFGETFPAREAELRRRFLDDFPGSKP